MNNQLAYGNFFQLSKRDKAYNEDPSSFKEFLSFSPDEEGLLKALESRNSISCDRDLLKKEVERQYASIDISEKVETNINALTDENTFTVITAHQPSLLTGPLYYIFKIFSCINLAETLTAKSGKKVVPVFINGSEDHDFEEIDHCNIFGKKIIWERESKGPVGRLDLVGLRQSIYQLQEVLGGKEKSEQLIKRIYEHLDSANGYNDFVLRLVNDWFGNYGLVVVSMDNISMKRQFSNIMKDELIRPVSKELVTKTQFELSKIGFDPQAHARDINFFFIDENGRNRIVKEDDTYNVVNTNLQWSETQLLNKLEENPQDFSPNVILRPLYQELIFPNVAYVGGGGELAYWMERKSLFKHYNVFFPCLIRRNSAMVIPKHIHKTLSKLNLEIASLLDFEDNVINSYVKSNSEGSIELDVYRNQISAIFQNIEKEAKDLDATLAPYIQKNLTNQLKSIDQIEAKLRKVAKEKDAIQINQIKKAYKYLFPNQGLQERNANILEFYINENYDIFEILKERLNPLDKDFKLIYVN